MQSWLQLFFGLKLELQIGILKLMNMIITLFAQNIWLPKIDGQQMATRLGVLIKIMTFWQRDNEETLIAIM